jgi:hypothetical protein
MNTILLLLGLTFIGLVVLAQTMSWYGDYYWRNNNGKSWYVWKLKDYVYMDTHAVAIRVGNLALGFRYELFSIEYLNPFSTINTLNWLPPLFQLHNYSTPSTTWFGPRWRIAIGPFDAVYHRATFEAS